MTIYCIHQDPELIDNFVALDAVVVTAVGPRGFFVQADADITPGYVDVQHSGIYVYTSTAPTVSQLDVVDITGARVSLYYDMIELTSPAYVATAQAPSLPQMVSLEQAELATQSALGKDNPLIGVLVQIAGASVSAVNGTYNAFTLQGGVVVDDEFYPGMPLPSPLLSVPLVRGSLAWSFDALTVWPRDAADLVY